MERGSQTLIMREITLIIVLAFSIAVVASIANTTKYRNSIVPECIILEIGKDQ